MADTVIQGSPQSDTLRATPGNDSIVGGAGLDTLVVGASSATAVFGIDALGHWVIGGPEGQDTLTSIEFVQFSDGVVVLGGNDSSVGAPSPYYLRDVGVAAVPGGYVMAWATADDQSRTAVLGQRYAATALH